MKVNSQNESREKQRRQRILHELRALYPQPRTALDFRNPYELLVATILSARSTDKTVNEITPALFRKYPTAKALAAADASELEGYIHSTGFFRNKARSLLACARAIVENHAGQVPDTMEELVKLPGVGRKTANVVLGSAFGKNEGVVVDTHVQRLAQRLGFTKHTDPVKIEADLMTIAPRQEWANLGHRLILHGRQVCAARKPKCNLCTLAPDCPARQI